MSLTHLCTSCVKKQKVECSSVLNTPYMSPTVAKECEKIQGQIDIQMRSIEKNELLNSLRRLGDEKRLAQVIRKCKLLNGNQQWGYLQRKLNTRLNLTDHNVRSRQIGEILFYYLMRDKEPAYEVTLLIEALYNQFFVDKGYNWYEVFCYMMLVESDYFTSFFTRLVNTALNLEYLMYKQPRLLLNKYAYVLKEKLNQKLPFNSLHKLLLNTKDEQGQTCMFYIKYWSIDQYEYHNADLFELLSSQNRHGQTAFHVNTDGALRALFNYITLSNQEQLMQLLSIQDQSGKTVNETARGNKLLAWFQYQVEHDNYLMYYYPKVLIFYNVIDRPGAENEAKSLAEAFESLTLPFQIELMKMETKKTVVQTIREAAARLESVFIVCMMSHGSVGTIEDSEGKMMSITSIEGAMCSDHLKHRPKILITQCCQLRNGRDGRSDEEAASSDVRPPVEERFVPYVPVADHFLAVQSCVCEQTSERNVFIRHLAEQIKASTKTDNFEDLIKKASNKMLTEGKTQVPIAKSTLRRKICLKADHCP